MRHDGHQSLHQLKVRLLEGNVDLAVDEFSNLGLCSLGDGWVTVAQVGDTDATGEIEVLAAAYHFDIAAGSALEDLWREAADAFGDMLGAELDELLGGGAHDWRRWGKRGTVARFCPRSKRMEWIGKRRCQASPGALER